MATTKIIIVSPLNHGRRFVAPGALRTPRWACDRAAASVTSGQERRLAAIAAETEPARFVRPRTRERVRPSRCRAGQKEASKGADPHRRTQSRQCRVTRPS
jgi:hypothetical protein